MLMRLTTAMRIEGLLPGSPIGASLGEKMPEMRQSHGKLQIRKIKLLNLEDQPQIAFSDEEVTHG